MSDYPPLTLVSRLPFGKYVGYTVKEVMSIDEGYIKWWLQNVDIPITMEEEDELDEYITNHPNPFNLNRSQLTKAIVFTLTRITTKGYPTADDWD